MTFEDIPLRLPPDKFEVVRDDKGALVMVKFLYEGLVKESEGMNADSE